MAQDNTKIVLDAVIKAVRDTFSVQVGVPVDVSAATIDPNNKPSVDVLSVLSLKSTTLTGSLGLCFPKASFLAIHEKMTGEKHPEVTKANSDTCGELLNILYAGARVSINSTGHDFQPAIPNTVRGNTMDITTGAKSNASYITCKSEFGNFWVYFSLKPVEKT